MKMIRRVQKTCVLPLLLLAVMLGMLLNKGVESAYEIYVADVQVQDAQSLDQVELMIHGGNLLRINSFYIDGERVEDCEVWKMTYDRCRVMLNASAFKKGNAWYELRVGYHKWGFIDLLSSPVWIEWVGA